MTEAEVKTLRFRPTIFASLEKGGHLQVKTNTKYGVCMVHRKETRNHEWRSYFTIGGTENREYYGKDGELDLAGLVEALKDVPYDGSGPE